MAHRLSTAPDVEEREELLPVENNVSSPSLPNDKQLFSELCKNETRSNILQEFESVKDEANDDDGANDPWLRRLWNEYSMFFWLPISLCVSDYAFTESFLTLKITGCDDLRATPDDACNIYGDISLCECFSSNFAACHGGLSWKAHMERWDVEHISIAATALCVWLSLFLFAYYTLTESTLLRRITVKLLFHRVFVQRPTYSEVFRHNWKFVALCSMAASSIALRVFLGCLQESYHYVRHPGDDLCDHEVDVIVYYTSYFNADQILAKNSVWAVFVAVAPLACTGAVIWLKYFNEVIELCRFSYKEIKPSVFVQLEEKILIRVRWETMQLALSQSLLPEWPEKDFELWLPEFISTLREVAYVQSVKDNDRYKESYKWRHNVGKYSRLIACSMFFVVCLVGAAVTVFVGHLHYMGLLEGCGVFGSLAFAGISYIGTLLERAVVKEMRLEAKDKIEKRAYGELDNT